MKSFWKQWLIIFGISIPVGVLSGFGAVFYVDYILTSYSGFTTLFLGIRLTYIVYYIAMLVLGFFICKRKISRTIITVLTSPLSLVAHTIFIWDIGSALLWF
jgi:hypothetical protein